MSLTTRLCMFFLSALALVLITFSGAVYLVEYVSLHANVSQRLQAALSTLTAVAEVGADGIEWEASERLIQLTAGNSPDLLRWAVTDDHGQVVDASAHRPEQELLTAGTWDPALAAATRVFDRHERAWQLLQRRVSAKAQSNVGDAASQDRAGGDGGTTGYPALVLTAAVPLHEVDSALRQLAIVLSGLSAGTWLLAAVLGQWLCRRAIRPITGMASAARAMGAADHAERLPVAATHDELEELGRSFNDLLGRLHESFERQRRFTGEAAHQLRTPLTAILGQVDVTLRRSRTADEYREIISKVHSQAIHLRQLVEMLLFLARADAEAMLPDLETINLAAWLPDHLRGWSGHARAADLHFSAVPNGSTRVRAHGPLLGQLLDNLLDNACNYSPPGTPITIRLRAEPSQQIVDVEDIGPGIATEDLPHVFEPFFRASQTRHSVPRGIGLGLSVAQRIAGAFNGGVLVAANEPRGTRFTIRLPSAPADKEASQNKGRPE